MKRDKVGEVVYVDPFANCNCDLAGHTGGIELEKPDSYEPVYNERLRDASKWPMAIAVGKASDVADVQFRVRMFREDDWEAFGNEKERMHKATRRLGEAVTNLRERMAKAMKKGPAEVRPRHPRPCCAVLTQNAAAPLSAPCRSLAAARCPGDNVGMSSLRVMLHRMEELCLHAC